MTKKPQSEAAYSLEQQAEQFDFYRTVADATGPFNTGHSLPYRAIFAHQDNHSFRHEVSMRRFLFSPSLMWQRLTPHTRFSLNFEYKYFKDTLDGGIPAVEASGIGSD